MARRYYSSTAVATTLDSGMSAGATSMTVVAVTGFPSSFPYTLIIDPDGTEEVVTVTAGGGTTLTVTRGQDGTSAVAHDAGVTVQHGVSARDFDEPNAHIADSAAVHGVTGSVVGTTDTQTLTNKTLTSPTITTPTITVPVIASFASAEHTHAAAGATGGTVAHSDLTGLTSGDPHTQYQKESEKGAAGGYASLDGSTKVPYAELPTGTAASTVAIGDHTHGYLFSGCKATRTASQAIADTSPEAVTFTGAEGYDTDAYHETSGSSSRFTIPTGGTGYYRILAQVTWEGNSTGRRVLDLRLNDSSSDGSAGNSIAKSSDSPGALVTWPQQVMWEGALTAADYLKLVANQSSGGSLNLDATTEPGIWLTIHRLG